MRSPLRAGAAGGGWWLRRAREPHVSRAGSGLPGVAERGRRSGGRGDLDVEPHAIRAKPALVAVEVLEVPVPRDRLDERQGRVAWDLEQGGEPLLGGNRLDDSPCACDLDAVTCSQALVERLARVVEAENRVGVSLEQVV